jgi:hypothetical protein
VIDLARDDNVVAVPCELEAGHKIHLVAPIIINAYCPGVLRNIIEQPVPWKVGDTELSTNPMRYINDEGGQALSDIIKNPSRRLP